MLLLFLVLSLFPVYSGSFFQQLLFSQQSNVHLFDTNLEQNSTPGLKKFQISINREDNSIAIKHNPDGEIIKGQIRNKGISFQSVSSSSFPTSSSSGGKKRIRQVATDAIFGFYQLPYGLHILIVDDSSTPFNRTSSTISSILQNIHLVTRFKLISLTSSLSLSERLRDASKQRYAENLLLSALKRHQFYFSLDSSSSSSSYSYDITKSYQKNQQRIHSQQNKELIGGIGKVREKEEEDDDRFFWNKNVLQPLHQHFPKFSTAFCNAFIKRTNLLFGNDDYLFTLISRRSRERQGPRYIKRGADEDGAVANFVETEQIIEKSSDPKQISSFVQVRGSIPFLWKQIQTWKLKPPVLNENDDLENEISIQRHFEKLIQRYLRVNDPSFTVNPSIYCLNLIDKKGPQGLLGTTWLHLLNRLSSRGKSNQNFIEENTSLDRNEITDESFLLSNATVCTHMIWFDYHHHMKESNKLYLLFDKIKPIFTSKHGFYDSNHNYQNSLIRTNCMDCLDRTNVVQTTISRWALFQQIMGLHGKINCAASSLSIADQASESNFRELWTENGDMLSLLYAGSNAMKRDVTRLGKRTNQGVMDDAISYAKRYVSNNYQDYEYQNSIDFLIKNQISYETFERNQSARKSRENALNDLRRSSRNTNPNVQYSFTLPIFDKSKDTEREVEDLVIDVAPPGNRTLEEKFLLGLSAITAMFMFL